MNTLVIEHNGEHFICRGGFDPDLGGLTDIKDSQGNYIGELVGYTPPDGYDEESLTFYTGVVNKFLKDLYY